MERNETPASSVIHTGIVSKRKVGSTYPWPAVVSNPLSGGPNEGIGQGRRQLHLELTSLEAEMNQLIGKHRVLRDAHPVATQHALKFKGDSSINGIRQGSNGAEGRKDPARIGPTILLWEDRCK